MCWCSRNAGIASASGSSRNLGAGRSSRPGRRAARALPYGGTVAHGFLTLALLPRMLTEAIDLGPDVIYFLTDEDDLESRDVLAVTRRNRGRVSIHALCLVPPGGESPMQRLARDNRGVFQVVK